MKKSLLALAAGTALLATAAAQAQESPATGAAPAFNDIPANFNPPALPANCRSSSRPMPWREVPCFSMRGVDGVCHKGVSPLWGNSAQAASSSANLHCLIWSCVNVKSLVLLAGLRR